MTDSEITTLAREYAEEIYPHEEGENLGQMEFLRSSAVKHIEASLKILTRRFCLVDKDTVREALYKLTDKFLEDNDHKAFGAASAAIESLFPEIGKEVE